MIHDTTLSSRKGAQGDGMGDTGVRTFAAGQRGWAWRPVAEEAMDRPAATGVIQPRFAESARDEGAE